jgi:hypothetical protein
MSGTELDRYAPMAPTPVADALPRWVSVLVPASQIADRIANTEFVPSSLRGKPEAITACIMYGDEIGVGPMQALMSIHVVDGRPYPSSELFRAMILRAGHRLTVHELTGTRARVSGLRAGAPESERTTVEWTTDMARAAGLLGKKNWREYPRAMLLARATGDLARMVFPDVVKGLGMVAEDDAAELGTWAATVDEAPEPAPTPRKAVQRRTRPRNAAPAQDPPAVSERPGEARGAPYVEPPNPPAPTRVDPVDRPLPGMPVDTPLPPVPELDTEGPPEVAPRGKDTIGPAQLRALHTMLGKTMGPVQRADKLAMLGAILGHPVPTSTGITRAEGFRALSFLDAIQTGQATWEVIDGELVVTDLRDPPDEPPSESVG